MSNLHSIYKMEEIIAEYQNKINKFKICIKEIKNNCKHKHTEFRGHINCPYKICLDCETIL